MPHTSDPPYRLAFSVPADGVRVAAVGGDLDYVVTPALRRMLLDAFHGVPVLVLDLSGVTLLSAAAMEMLVDLADLGRDHGVAIRVVAGTRPVVRPLTLVGLDSRLALYPTVSAAVQG